MANRLKTIQFVVPTYTSVIPDATVQNLDQITLYIPETVIAFRSVTVEVGFRDVITATGGTITEHRVGVQLGAAGYSTVTETDDIANSGENIAGVIAPFDFTSYFTTNWSGSSMTFDTQVYFDQSTGTTLGMRNVNAIITVTYEYDDSPVTNATQIKTAWIPLESLVNTLGTTANGNIGTSQIPILTGASGLLSENGVVIRDYAFIIEANDGNTATTDFVISVNIDSGTPLAFGTMEAALATSLFQRLTYKPSIPDTTATHNFQMWTSVANKMAHASILLQVTYEFTPATSTKILNSILLPIELATPIGATTSAEASRFTRDIFVQEPDTITLLQSAFRINYNCAAPVSGVNLRAGGQSFRTYTNQGSVMGGMFTLTQRIDSGSVQGAGITLVRGKNTIVIDAYATDTVDQMTNVNGVIILNYHSGKVASGLVGAHAHTIIQKLLNWNALLADRTRINNYSFTIPESLYWIVGAGYVFYQWVTSASMAVTFDVECLSGEGKGAGYYDIYADAYQTDNERACSIIYMRGRDVFKRYPSDPDPDRIDIETARDYRLFTSTTAANGLLAILTYHSITFTVAGTVSGYAGDGSGITVEIFRATTHEKIGEAVTSAGGGYTFDWYDDTEEIFGVARQDGTRVGRSDNAIAV